MKWPKVSDEAHVSPLYQSMWDSYDDSKKSSGDRFVLVGTSFLMIVPSFLEACYRFTAFALLLIPSMVGTIYGEICNKNVECYAALHLVWGVVCLLGMIALPILALLDTKLGEEECA